MNEGKIRCFNNIIVVGDIIDDHIVAMKHRTCHEKRTAAPTRLTCQFSRILVYVLGW